MKLLSKNLFLLALGFFLVTGGSFASTREDLFNQVPAGDSTYGQLGQLEDAGLLAVGDSKGPLTRYEVAKRIFKAERKYKEIVVAQADMDLPPPPPDENGGAAAGGTATSTGGAGEEAAPKPASSLWNDPAKIAEAEKNLKSLQGAYDFELGLVRDQKSTVEDQVSKAEAAQYSLWKGLKGISQYPSVSIHGVGRAFGISQQNYGSGVSFISGNATRLFLGYLDLEPTGSISKEIRFHGIIRFSTLALPVGGTSFPPPTGIFSSPGTNSDYIQFHWITAEFNPDFMSATIGDFYETYTPFTLWNRSALDLYYKPEQVERDERFRKYESFYDQAPAWPFRGLRLGTAVGWENSNLLELFKISTFAHMIRNGFAEGAGWFIGPINGVNTYTDWVFAGSTQLKLKKWYLGDASVQLTTDAYGIVLDEPLDTTLPGSPYGRFNPATWAHQYLIGSLHPVLKVGLGGDVYAGGQYEGAFSSYQDDKMNNTSVVSDYALNLGAFFQVGDSKLSFSYLNVGPYYYSPLAQAREDLVFAQFTGTTVVYPYIPLGPGLAPTPYRSRNFLYNVPRPGDIFLPYDRTQDNTFPYGLATPNRQGIGMDIDVETLKNKSLKIRGAAYFVQEISGNLVVNSGGTGYTGLDTPPGGTVPPVRKFTYVNMGPSFDLGPSLGLETPLELGTNIRYEQTSSSAGTLNSTSLLGGLRIGFFPWWEVSTAFSWRNANGKDEGVFGTTLARYSYLFDNRDLGIYFPFNVNGTEQNFLLSTTFNVNRNSKIHFDYSLASGSLVPYFGNAAGVENNQYMELTYEIEF